jgi:hypothetical protein
MLAELFLGIYCRDFGLRPRGFCLRAATNCGEATARGSRDFKRMEALYASRVA